jgi:hypothetical protein
MLGRAGRALAREASTYDKSFRPHQGKWTQAKLGSIFFVG